MNSRTELTRLLDKLHHFPNKNRIHLLQGALLILKLLIKAPDGNTLLRIPEDKPYIATIVTYLNPFAKHLEIGTQKKYIAQLGGEFACVSNIQPATLEKLQSMLQIEQLIEEVAHRVGNSYQRIIIGLQLENQRLHELLNQKKSLEKSEEKIHTFPSPTSEHVEKNPEPRMR